MPGETPRSCHSNSEQDIKYPHRGHTNLHCLDSSLFEHTGQNWTGRSRDAAASFTLLSTGSIIPLLTGDVVRSPHRAVTPDEGRSGGYRTSHSLICRRCKTRANQHQVLSEPSWPQISVMWAYKEKSLSAALKNGRATANQLRPSSAAPDFVRKFEKICKLILFAHVGLKEAAIGELRRA